MAYNLDFLDRSDTLQESQPGLLENFQEIFALIGQDHEQFNTANAGKHKQLTLPGQNKAQLPNTGAAEFALFNSLVAIIPNNPQVKLPTLNFQSSLSTALSAAQGSFTNANILEEGQRPGLMSLRLPSGILIKWSYLPAIQEGSGELIFEWDLYDNEEPFVAQYWAAIFQNQANISTAPQHPTYYVTDISIPDRIKYRAWITNEFNSPVLGFRFPVQFVAIGV